MGLIKEEQNEGVIIEKRKDRIWVAINPACDSSKDCHTGCGACGGSTKVKKSMLMTSSASSYSLGQKVHFRHFLINEAIGALIVFGIPVFLAILALILWYIRVPEQVESPMAIFSTGVAFVTGFGVVWLIDKLFRTRFPSTLLTSPEDHPKDNG